MNCDALFSILEKKMGIKNTKPAEETPVPASEQEADKAKIKAIEKRLSFFKERINEVCTLKIIWGYSIFAGPPPDRTDQPGSFLITLGSIFENFILIH